MKKPPHAVTWGGPVLAAYRTHEVVMYMSVASAIREYLKSHGIKQSFVAEKCGWSRQKLNCIINGKSRMTVEDYQVLCKSIGVSYEVFLDAEQN